MDQRSICLFLAMKGLSGRDVHNELVAVLGLDAIAYSTVTSYLWQRKFPAISSEPSNEPPTTIINDAILDALDKQPFSSVKELVKLTCIPTTTVDRHLTRSLGFVVKHLRWVPHTLTDTQQAQRITLSNQLLLEICSIKHQGWHFIITVDESWFYFSMDHEQIWLRPDQEPPERAKHTIQDKKIRVTIAWNALGFHLVEALPKGRRFNAEYYCDNILTELILLRPQAGERNLIIHADNARPHTAQNCRTFVSKMGCGSPHTSHTRPISRRQTSSSSVMLKIAGKESYLHHVRNYLQELVRYWTRLCPRLCHASSSTGLRDWNGFLRITVNTIDKINIH
jgi:hypothetical protein